MLEQQSNNLQNDNVYMDNLYIVEAIMKKRKTSQGYKYLIRWKDYPDQKDFTWQPLANLTSVRYMVDQFQRKMQQKKNKMEETVSSKKQALKQSNKQISKQNQEIGQSNKQSQKSKNKIIQKNNNKPEQQSMNPLSFKIKQIGSFRQKQAGKYKQSFIPKERKPEKQEKRMEDKEKREEDKRNSLEQKLKRQEQRQRKRQEKQRRQEQRDKRQKDKEKEKERQRNEEENAKKIIFKQKNKIDNKQLKQKEGLKVLWTSQSLPQKKQPKPQNSILENPKNLQKPKQTSSSYYQNAIPTSIYKFGKIFNHFYKNGELYYQIQILNAQTGKALKIQMLSSSKLKPTCQSSINEYLQKLLIELEQTSKKI